MPTPTKTTTRMKVVHAFDYLTPGEYDATVCTRERKHVDFRRTDGSGIGCYVPAWQFRQAVASGSVVAA